MPLRKRDIATVKDGEDNEIQQDIGADCLEFTGAGIDISVEFKANFNRVGKQNDSHEGTDSTSKRNQC